MLVCKVQFIVSFVRLLFKHIHVKTIKITSEEGWKS